MFVCQALTVSNGFLLEDKDALQIYDIVTKIVEMADSLTSTILQATLLLLRYATHSIEPRTLSLHTNTCLYQYIASARENSCKIFWGCSLPENHAAGHTFRCCVR